MKRLISILLVMTIMTTLFVGCSKKEVTTEPKTEDVVATETDTDSTSDAATVAEKEPVTLTIWVPSRAEGDFRSQQEAKFLETHPYINLNVVVHEGDAGNDYFQGIAAGNAPDLVDCSFAMMDKYIAAGVLEPLNKYMDSWDETKNLPQKYIDMVTKDGNTYGLINEVSPMLFAYNKKLFAEAGIAAAPKDWDEMLADAKLLTKPDAQQVGYGMLAKEWCEWWFQYYVWQAGGDLTKKEDNGNVTLTFADPAAITAADYYKTLRAAGVTQTDLTMGFEDLVKAFAAGKIAMMPFAANWVGWVSGLGMPLEDIGLSLYPQGPAGNGKAAISGTYYVINPKSDQAVKDAAWEYISFIAGEEYIKAKYQDQAANGAVDPVPVPRTNLTMLDIVPDFDPVLADLLSQAAESGIPEFYAKATVGKYVDAAVQKIIADPSADPKTELEAAQSLAETEVLPDFNK